jgi:hypothetical protein
MSEDTSQYDELAELKAKADTIGLKYRKDITAENLRKKINEVLENKEASNDEETATNVSGEFADTKAPKGETENQRRVRKQKEAAELVRIQVTCMNPNKAEWDGEIVTAGNRVVGTHRKFVKFGVEYHVPRIIYNVLRDRKCQVFVTERDEKGRQMRKGKQINEFNIAVLPALTESELKDLAQRQAMAQGKSA